MNTTDSVILAEPPASVVLPAVPAPQSKPGETTAPPAQASRSRKPAPDRPNRGPAAKPKKALPPLTPTFALGILSSALGYVREAGIEVVVGNHPELGAVIAIKLFRAVESGNAGQPPDLMLATDLPAPAIAIPEAVDGQPVPAGVSVGQVTDGKTAIATGKPD